MPVEPWETLCPLCGVAPEGGPEYLADTWDILKDIEPLVPELRQLGAGKNLATQSSYGSSSVDSTQALKMIVSCPAVTAVKTTVEPALGLVIGMNTGTSTLIAKSTS